MLAISYHFNYCRLSDNTIQTFCRVSQARNEKYTNHGFVHELCERVKTEEAKIHAQYMCHKSNKC